MTWMKLDDKMPEHPKIVALGDYAEIGLSLQVSAIAWCNRNLTDGHLPKSMVPRLATFRGMSVGGAKVTAERVAERLTQTAPGFDFPIWEDRGDHYYVHDILDYQPSRADVLAMRAATTARVQRHRKRHGNGVTDTVGNGDRTPAPRPRPVPVEEEDPNSAGSLTVSGAPEEGAPAHAGAARPTCENPPKGNHALGIYERVCPMPDAFVYVPMIARLALETHSGCTNPKLCFDEDMRLYYKRRAHDVRTWTPRWDLATRQWFLRHAQMGGACQRKATPVDRARSADERKRHEAAQRRTVTPERPVTRAVAKNEPPAPPTDAPPAGGMESLGELFRRLRFNPAAAVTPEEEEALRAAEGGTE